MLLDKDFTTVDADLIFARVKGRPHNSIDLKFASKGFQRLQKASKGWNFDEASRCSFHFILSS